MVPRTVRLRRLRSWAVVCLVATGLVADRAAAGRAHSGGTQAAVAAKRAAAERGTMLECIRRGEGRQALVAAGRAVDSKRLAEPDSLEVARFTADLGTEFVVAATDSLRPLGLPLLMQALEIRRHAAGDHSRAVASATNVISTYYYLLGRYEEAAEWERRSLDVLEAIPGVPDSLLAFTRKDLGLVYYQLGRYTEAKDLFQSGLQVFETGPNKEPFLAADLNNCLGEIMRLEVRYEDSRRCFERATLLTDSLIAHAPDADLKLKYERFLGVVWLNRANLLYEQSRYNDAEARYRWVVALWEAKGCDQPMALPHAYLNVAEICRFQGRYSEAETLYKRALTLGRQEAGADNPDTFWFLHALAELFVEQGRYAEAEDAYRECIDLLERAGTAGAVRIGLPLRSLADLMRLRGRYDEAEVLYRRSADAYRDAVGMQAPELARTTVGLARCLFARLNPDLETARRLSGDALKILDATHVFPEARLDALLLTAEISHQEGDTRRAQAILAAALEGAEELRRGSSVDDRGRAAFFADYSPAFEKMVAWSLERGDVATAIQSSERFRARVLLEQMRLAGVDLMAGLPDSVRTPLARREQQANLDLAQTERRLAVLRQTPGPDSRDDSPRVQEIVRARDESLEKLRVVQSDVRRVSPLWTQSVASGDATITVQQIQDELVRKDEGLLLYCVGADASYAILVRKGTAPLAFALEIGTADAAALRVASGAATRNRLGRALSAVEPAVEPAADRPSRGVTTTSGAHANVPAGGERTVLDLLETPGDHFPETDQRRLHALWNVLIPAALQPMIRAMDRLVIVPDGILHRLPFEALVMDAPYGDNAPVFWLERGPIVRYAPSATVLWTQMGALRQRAAPPRTGGILSVSDATFQDSAAAAGSSMENVVPQQARGERFGALSRLPGTAAESERIVAAFGASAVDLLQRHAATEARVRVELAGKRYIHLATHGIVENRRDDTYAALALTPGGSARIDRDNDGFLELGEIYGLHLDADLVVLSACSTHQGTWVDGDGVFALSRGFLAAGCPRVIGSLWRVDDASTAQMIGDLFAELARAEHRKRTPDFAGALRDARLRLRRSRAWAHPYYWAPFVMLGQR